MLESLKESVLDSKVLSGYHLIFLPHPSAPLVYSTFAFPRYRLSPLFEHRSLISIQHIDHTAQFLNRRQCRIVAFIPLRLVIDNQTPCTLIQNPNDHLVQNHLAELPLHLLRVESYHLSNVLDFNAGKWLDDFDEILFQHSIVKTAEMIADEGVAAEFVAVVTKRFLVFFEGTVRVGAGNSFHGFEVLAGVFERLLRCHELIDIIGKVEHDFAKEHILKCCSRFLGLVLRVVSVQSFDEVRKGSVEILVLCMQFSRLHVQSCLEKRWRVD